MKLFLLDGAGALIIFVPILIVAMIVVILVEAGVMTSFKLNNFKRSLAHSAIINVASLAAGFALLPMLDFTDREQIWEWLIFFASTVLIEGLLLMLMNRNIARQKLWLAVIVMNLATYILLYLFFVFI